ncbi:nitroreductase family deazaflavin-dependent oxidoreductase [Gordonia sp. PDNC005]|uniref:nitroreductase family deazaflavin-dependent oxidoreductase n=1 Tax=unclassified Gordonia (in: high G+C Gram-positive bacteria) TaxID=2657482 RepID=UPI001966B9C8|nr:nitroreductase family deazaflavin-dependent oxidoreductase [Gordonia sp. PDNC005]QRY61208.1 nitroreductase family deazaflavin-dependent oxidoreductase [Gordonia sp. PDNC005]
MNDTRYEAPSGTMFTASNRLVGGLARIGAAPKGVHELRTVGRRTGEVRRTPVNVLDVGGRRFLFSPRGNTQWVRNVRAGGAVGLRRGRRTAAVTLAELDDAAKPEIIRDYLTKWGWQVSDFVCGLTAASSDDEILAVAEGFPVFEVRV